jgi:DNA-binding NarL/FixJ family response regulator
MREELRSILVAAESLRVTDAPAQLQPTIVWVEETRPDIVLYDAMLLLEAFTFLAAMQRSNVATKTIILLEDSSEEFVMQAAQRGAVGCLLRSTSPQELIKAIYVTYQGELWLSRRLLAKLFSNAYGRPISPSSPAGALTIRQRQIVELVSTGMSNRDIAANLFITDATVRAHLNDIFRKLGLHDRVELALLGRRTQLM